VTANPGNPFVTQAARELTSDLEESGRPPKFLVRDRDPKFTESFDQLFRASSTKVNRTPVRSPRANAVAERFVRTVRRECLDWTLVLGRHHLHAVLREHVAHYKEGRPHRGLDLGVPSGRVFPPGPVPAEVRRRDVLGGLVHEYERAAA
jgi:transposase InsO family protein